MNVKEFFISIVSLLLVLTPAMTYGKGAAERAGRDLRTNMQYDGWARMIPTHAKLQYAGGMGLLSAGAGWDYGPKGQWETDAMVGFLPEHYADGEARLTFTLKQNYIPWSIRTTRWLDIEPLTCGAYMNVISGSEFWNKEPGRYPGGHKGYYKFSSRTRFHIYVGQRLTFLTPRASALRSITLYYELSINDLMIVSGVNNRTLEFSDVVHFSVGAKMHLFKE